MYRCRYAYFVEHPRRIDDLLVPHRMEQERPYRVVVEINLSKIDYENFITDLLADRLFIEEHGNRCEPGEIWNCLLVRCKGQRDGVLVRPEESCFVGWAAYCYAEKK